ncbi:MAG TPA: MliC family protein [Burkholderiaceae bacterium]|nr:MliC family protein [Burkholderiaceae bacterium]
MKHGRAQRPALGAVIVVAALVPGLVLAQTRPAQPKPITREWNCTNGRTVLVNYHPKKIAEPAWLTYLGNRVEVTRKRVASGIAAESADGKVNWHEKGNEALLEFAGLLDEPLHCEAKAPATK